ncbi:putative methyltransferase-domain-containing protein [Polychytrium aggregatum]|uniref:putative methyltransferase-domain-containing protein n=1 Tax=Polychytrium aggregatum TaxID=110093 RepID=UPI0022FDF0AA|nr:putative methyltransferase-domain-containing protein [Polychytrium aggregatum]KAI9199261.1 putative methyltransferase-domain-containing protein [Polychytrium aggregatum]
MCCHPERHRLAAIQISGRARWALCAVAARSIPIDPDRSILLPLADSPGNRSSQASLLPSSWSLQMDQDTDITNVYSLELTPTTSLSLHEDSSTGESGTTVWVGGIKLAWHLGHEQSRGKLSLAGKRCIDLGSGTGVLGLAASNLGAGEVVLSDIQSVLDRGLLQRNLEANIPHQKANVRIERLHWDDQDDIRRLCPPAFDVILGSDVVYNYAAAEPLAKTIDALSQQGTVVWIAYERRDPLVADRFLSLMKGFGFDSKKVMTRSKRTIDPVPAAQSSQPSKTASQNDNGASDGEDNDDSGEPDEHEGNLADGYKMVEIWRFKKRHRRAGSGR